jgi:hypothetical protein
VKLVVDNDSNVEELPVGNVQDIPEMLRCLADDIEAGVWGDVETLIAVMVVPAGVSSVTYGENGSIYELAGILDAAKMQAIAAVDD